MGPVPANHASGGPAMNTLVAYALKTGVALVIMTFVLLYT